MRSDQLHASVSHARFGGKRCTQAAPVSKSSLLPAGLRVTAQRERFTHRCRFPSASELDPQAHLWIRVFRYHAPLSITLGIGIGSAGSPLQTCVIPLGGEQLRLSTPCAAETLGPRRKSRGCPKGGGGSGCRPPAPCTVEDAVRGGKAGARSAHRRGRSLRSRRAGEVPCTFVDSPRHRNWIRRYPL